MLSAHIIGSRTPGGAENFYLRLVGALADTPDHEVLAVVRRHGAVAAALEPHITRHELTMANVYDLWARRRIRALIRKHRPAIVQTWMGRATRLTHGITPAVHVARLGNYYKLDGYRHAQAWIGNTAGICAYLTDNGFPRKRVYYVPNFVDVAPPVTAAERTRLRAAHDIPQEAYVILGIGRYTPIKGFDLLLEAVARLPDPMAGRAPRLLMAGAGPLEGPLRARARQADLAGRVEWLGWQRDPAPWYRLADVVAFPCRPGEPFGNVPFEAWAQRHAVVPTRSRGALASSRHGVGAWQVADADAPALAAGLEMVLHQKLYEKILVSRPIVPLGQDIGYLPGDKDEKLRHWMQPIFDNLEFLSTNHTSPGSKTGGYQRLLDMGLVELEPLTYIQIGRAHV